VQRQHVDEQQSFRFVSCESVIKSDFLRQEQIADVYLLVPVFRSETIHANQVVAS
jgi:hypothetical protein